MGDVIAGKFGSEPGDIEYIVEDDEICGVSHEEANFSIESFEGLTYIVDKESESAVYSLTDDAMIHIALSYLLLVRPELIASVEQ